MYKYIQQFSCILTEDNACCTKIKIDGNDELRQLHGNKLGVYEKTTVHGHNDQPFNGHDQVFKLSGREYYLHLSQSMHCTVRLI